MSTHRYNNKNRKYLSVTIIAIIIISSFGLLIGNMGEDPHNTPKVKEPNNPEFVPRSATPIPTNSPTTNPTNPWTTGNSINSNIPIFAPYVPGLMEASPVINSSIWLEIANNAWKYFQPGVGIDSTTGLPASSYGYNEFTDWDLSIYIQTVIDAEKLGLITKEGIWGSKDRIDKVITFLETRPLNRITKTPYWFYSSTGQGVQEKDSIDIADTGALFVALNNIKKYDNTFAKRIDNIVYNNINNKHDRTDYASIIPSLKIESLTSTSLYSYYVLYGFSSFFPNELAGAPNRILENIRSAGNVTDIHGSVLPKGKITCEPLLYSIFYLDNNAKIKAMMDQVYSAHYARFEATKKYIAFSEGNTGRMYIYEWVVLPNGDTWKITEVGYDSYLENRDGVVFSKVAFGFLSIYNSTYAREMCVYIEKNSPESKKGYYEGVDYEGSNPAAWINVINSNTNGLIISAARYAIK